MLSVLYYMYKGASTVRGGAQALHKDRFRTVIIIIIIIIIIMLTVLLQ